MLQEGCFYTEAAPSGLSQCESYFLAVQLKDMFWSWGCWKIVGVRRDFVIFAALTRKGYCEVLYQPSVI